MVNIKGKARRSEETEEVIKDSRGGEGERRGR